MPNVDYHSLLRITQAIVEAVGTPPASAQAVAESLVGIIEGSGPGRKSTGSSAGTRSS